MREFCDFPSDLGQWAGEVTTTKWPHGHSNGAPSLWAAVCGDESLCRCRTCDWPMAPKCPRKRLGALPDRGIRPVCNGKGALQDTFGSQHQSQAQYPDMPSVAYSWADLLKKAVWHTKQNPCNFISIWKWYSSWQWYSLVIFWMLDGLFPIPTILEDFSVLPYS